MPSRRRVLAGLAAVGLPAAGYAAAQTHFPGRLRTKSITVRDAANHTPFVLDVARGVYDEATNGLRVVLADAVDAAFERPATLTVPDDVHQWLHEEFDHVSYRLGFENDGGQYVGRVSRSDFDRIGFGDRARVVTLEWFDDEVGLLRVVDRDVPIELRRVDRFSLDQRRSRSTR